MTAPRRARSLLSPIRAACTGLIALLLVSLLGLAQSQVVASNAAVSAGAGISVAPQGDAVALLRVTGKTQALEVRAGRALPVKFVSGNPGMLAPAVDLLLVDLASPTQSAAAPAIVPTRQAGANQPRAPPLA